MSDLPCTQLTPRSVYPAALAIHYVTTVRGNSSRYTDDTLVSCSGRGDGLLYVQHHLQKIRKIQLQTCIQTQKCVI